MKLIDLKCSNCGATMQVNPDLKQVSCNYCGNTMLVDDEIKKMELVNGYDYGREVERGRIVTQKEQELDELSGEWVKKIVLISLWSVVLIIMIIICVTADPIEAKVFVGGLCILPFSGLCTALKGFFSVQYKINKAQKAIEANRK